MGESAKFHYHQGIAPMMWVLFVLSLLELVVVHIFVALKWPVIGWTLTTISALGAIWLVWWILSMKRLPHELRDDVLILRLGSMKSYEVPLANIAEVTSTFEPGALGKKDALNLAAIAHPNRCLKLKEPMARGKARIYVRLDQIADFDTALKSHGLEIT